VLARDCPELTRAGALGTIDVIATRIWLDQRVPTDTPANVFSRFAGLRGAGGTFFMLDQLQVRCSIFLHSSGSATSTVSAVLAVQCSVIRHLSATM
jgi:hypothetical protein